MFIHFIISAVRFTLIVRKIDMIPRNTKSVIPKLYSKKTRNEK